jgi:hypothetical protein
MVGRALSANQYVIAKLHVMEAQLEVCIVVWARSAQLKVTDRTCFIISDVLRVRLSVLS